MTVAFYSSRSKMGERTTLKDAMMRGQAADGGLFVPVQIPKVSPEFVFALSSLSDHEIAQKLSATWLDGSVDASVARQIARDAITFTAPLVQIGSADFVLELFHGPTFAFKDYGARYMARLLSHFLAEASQKQTILVATSGDTGSAVAAGFLGLPNIRVVVLYPKGRVSALQEKQMTTLGHNITALEINGSFDDCQSLVKAAFADEKLRATCHLNSANSINFARLVAQTFYYFIAYARLLRRDKAPVFAIPSGNLGNLTAGVLAKRMGLPVHAFVAATNMNDAFVAYLSTGHFEPQPSRHTMSNAMDVGNPSNLERLLALYEGDRLEMKKDIVGFSVSEALTAEAMQSVSDEYGYVLDPHGAVGYHGLSRWRIHAGDDDRPGVVLATAHPGKFRGDVERVIGRELTLPQEFIELQGSVKRSVPMENNFEDLQKWLYSAHQ